MAVAIFGCVGNKRGFFENDQFSPNSSTKRLRSVGPSSPTLQCRPPALHQQNSLPEKVSIILGVFPDMDPQLVAETLQSVDENVDAAIRRLEELQLTSSTTSNTESSSVPTAKSEVGENLATPSLAPVYADTIVQELAGASGVDEARARAVGVLSRFEAQVAEEAVKVERGKTEQETGELKAHVQALARDNFILKRAVTIQSQRQQEHVNRDQEVAQLQQTIVQYQEQLKNAELYNYALSMHLRQATSSDMPGPNPRNPDVC